MGRIGVDEGVDLAQGSVQFAGIEKFLGVVIGGFGSGKGLRTLGQL